MVKPVVKLPYAYVLCCTHWPNPNRAPNMLVGEVAAHVTGYMCSRIRAGIPFTLLTPNLQIEYSVHEVGKERYTGIQPGMCMFNTTHPMPRTPAQASSKRYFVEQNNAIKLALQLLNK